MPLRRGNWNMYALVGTAYAEEPVEAEEKSLDISDLTAKEIDEKVESGELTADEVYKAELAGKQRKGVLAKYGEDDKGTTAEDN